MSAHLFNIFAVISVLTLSSALDPVRRIISNGDLPAASSTVLNASAWQAHNADYLSAEDFPEVSLDSVASRPSAAISFSGGGARAYIAAIGILAGLSQLKLIGNVRYMTGVSGGSWATMVYTYAQNVSSEVEFLGPILYPSEMTQEKLQEMNSYVCARSFTASSFINIAWEAIESGAVSSLSDAWAYSVQKVYLDPVKIPTDTYFSWDTYNQMDIKKRNTELTESTFLLPVDEARPYPIITATMVGTVPEAPYTYSPDNRNYTYIEFTPIYSGSMRPLSVSYTSVEKPITTNSVEIGGVVETFAFGRTGVTSPETALPAGEPTGYLSVPQPAVALDIQYATGSSSWAAASFIDSLPKDSAERFGGMIFDYWSPADPSVPVPPAEEILMADGGAYQNVNLFSLLQREVEKIVLCFMTSVPLKPASDWNVYTDKPSTSQIDFSLSAFFGVQPDDFSTLELRSYDYSKNHVFDSSIYPTVVTALQDAQAQGNGIIASFNLTTIENSWWGIPSGRVAEVTFIYLGRVGGWEAQLSPEMQELLIPSDPAKATDYSETVSSGPFQGFPNYATTAAALNYERANVLADLMGWVVLENAALFESIFSA